MLLAQTGSQRDGRMRLQIQQVVLCSQSERADNRGWRAGDLLKPPEETIMWSLDLPSFLQFSVLYKNIFSVRWYRVSTTPDRVEISKFIGQR